MAGPGNGGGVAGAGSGVAVAGSGVAVACSGSRGAASKRFGLSSPDSDSGEYVGNGLFGSGGDGGSLISGVEGGVLRFCCGDCGLGI